MNSLWDKGHMVPRTGPAITSLECGFLAPKYLVKIIRPWGSSKENLDVVTTGSGLCVM